MKKNDKNLNDISKLRSIIDKEINKEILKEVMKPPEGVETYSIKEVVEEVTENYDNRRAILLRGHHGQGKSEIVKKMYPILAERCGYKTDEFVFHDIRMAGRATADLIGMPQTAKLLIPRGSKKVERGMGRFTYLQKQKKEDAEYAKKGFTVTEDGSSYVLKTTRFSPPDWFLECAVRPGILFLDEINRAQIEVMQACFELVYDRRLTGVTLHDDIWIFAGMNEGIGYSVTDMDNAFFSRFNVFDVYATVEEWLEWGETPMDEEKSRGAVDSDGNPITNIHPKILEFHMENEGYLDSDPDLQDNESKIKDRDRRAWSGASDMLTLPKSGWKIQSKAIGRLDKDEFSDKDVYKIRRSLNPIVGSQASQQFTIWLRGYKDRLKPQDILNSFSQHRNTVKKANRHMKLKYVIDLTEMFVAVANGTYKRDTGMEEPGISPNSDLTPNQKTNIRGFLHAIEDSAEAIESFSSAIATNLVIGKRAGKDSKLLQSVDSILVPFKRLAKEKYEKMKDTLESENKSSETSQYVSSGSPLDDDNTPSNVSRLRPRPSKV